MVSNNFVYDKTGVRSKTRMNKMLAGTDFIMTDSRDITPTLKENLNKRPNLSSAVTAATMKATSHKQVGTKRQAQVHIGKPWI